MLTPRKRRLRSLGIWAGEKLSGVGRAALQFAKGNTVMVIALVAAIVTMFFVPVNEKYLGYFDLKTLSCLFCVLAVVCALKNISFFYILARRVVLLCRNARLSILVLVYITFIGSMLIANDMALLTFLPLGYFVLKQTNKTGYMAFTFIMQNIAANLGGMLTPFGNPQNLYLYTTFKIPNLEFVGIMLAPFLVSVTLITLCCIVFVKPEPLQMENIPVKLPVWRTVIYLSLFALAIAIVFRGIPYWLGLLIIPAVLLVADRKALKMVDYPLLLTFVFFFVFSGNMAEIEPVRQLLSKLMNISTLLFSVLSCQIISNVPSAILLSHFVAPENYADLLVGVNIGGVGTLISSLASLITFSQFTAHNPGKTGSYIRMFCLFNFAFLILLTGFMFLLKLVM